MNEKKMTYNPYSPAVLQALKDLRAKTSAVIDLYDMTYKIPYSPIVHSLTDYLDKHFGNPPRDTCTDDEVRALDGIPRRWTLALQEATMICEFIGIVGEL